MEKLVPNLMDKKTNEVNTKKLNQVVKHGLKLNKVYQTSRFKQFLDEALHHVEYHAKKTTVKNEFEKDFSRSIGLELT